MDANVVCLACWHFRRSIALEDEYHVVCACPEYNKARLTLLSKVAPAHSLDSLRAFLQILSSSEPAVLEALGVFLSRTRQTRRKLKLTLERYNHEIVCSSFAAKRAAWRLRGRATCRHGVLFDVLPPGGCKCMSANSEELDWATARYMPALNAELKTIVARPFIREHYTRLAVLQHSAQRLGW